ncbi:MAG: pyruvate kinase [Oscillospiraceae bacterium]|nr:pyruvate kinase [Oscillospiraceae bacterium]
MRKTKIICTLGPAVDNEEKLKELMRNGMDCARFNFSHGTHEEHKVRMDTLKRIRAELNLPIAILLDTKGPEIRVGKFRNGSADLEQGQNFTLDTDSSKPGDNTRASLTYAMLSEYVKPGTRILVDDGKIALEVSDVTSGVINCKVLNRGKISDRKSINVPGISIPMPYLSDTDRSDIIFGIEQEVDFVAASFIRSAEDVRAVRELLNENRGNAIKIISKIENTQGLKNLDEIIEYSDGIMVARGDLGVELPFKEIPPIQKKMISKCTDAGKIVVTATQMLESMTKSPRPTRAEVSDVANAIYDGTTAIMLSGESASGDYPAEAVLTMAEIAESTENSMDYTSYSMPNAFSLGKTIISTTCQSACCAADFIKAKALVVVTRSARTASALSAFRPNCPIIAATIDERGRHQLNLCWGVRPISAVVQPSIEDLIKYAKTRALETRLVGSGDIIVIAIGSSVDEAGVSDTIRIVQLT